MHLLHHFMPWDSLDYRRTGDNNSTGFYFIHNWEFSYSRNDSNLILYIYQLSRNVGLRVKKWYHWVDILQTNIRQNMYLVRSQYLFSVLLMFFLIRLLMSKSHKSHSLNFFITLILSIIVCCSFQWVLTNANKE